MEHLLSSITWPGVVVIAILVFGAVALINDWPTLVKKTTVINNHYGDKEKTDDSDL